MILQHIKKSSTSGSDILFISRACVCVCACVYNSFSFEERRGEEERCWGISVIVDFVNPSRTFLCHANRSSRGERPNHPKNIGKKKKENRINKITYPPSFTRSPPRKEEGACIILKKKKKNRFPSNLETSTHVFISV